MNSIVLLCGGNNAGKSTTFNKFFEGYLFRKIRRMNFYKRNLDGRIIYGAGSDSPQELQQLKTKTLCDVEWIKDNVEKRIQLCEDDCKGENYVLIIPWGMYENEARDRLNEDCFIKPVECLRRKGFDVFPIYLRKLNPYAQHRAQKDELARRITLKEIETHGKDGCDKSKELEKIIIEDIIKKSSHES